MIIRLALIFFNTVNILIFLRVIISWIPIHNDFTEFVRDFTDPILKPFRLIIPIGSMGGLDLAPFLAIFALRFIQQIVLNILM